MNRREILKQLAWLSGGLMLVPSCDFSREEILHAYDQLNVTADAKALLQKLCNTIIPSDEEHPGAEELAMSDFVLVMLNDCYGPEDQKKFMNGLQRLNTFAFEQARQNFLSMSQSHAEELVKSIIDHPPAEDQDAHEDISNFEDVRYLVQTTKSLTIQGFMASEYIMTQVMPYHLVPGPFHGKVPLTEQEKINIYG